jgi:uncharacterized protein (DUF1800 family)
MKTQLACILIVLILSACGGGGGDATSPASAGEDPSPIINPDPDPSPPSTAELNAASKLLNVATFGPTLQEIEAAAEQGLDDWLDEQFALEASSHMEIVNRYIDEYGLDFDTDPIPGVYRRYAFWERAITAPDQLRQLTAYALSQIFVVSDNVDAFLLDPRALATFYDMLLDNAFGNFRDLLLDVTLNPSMGFYLSHVNNAKTDPVANTFPDENYAREVMQLFSIGLFELNQDGTQRLDAQGNAIPTYDNATIREFSRVFTGLSYGPEQPGEAVVFGLDRRIFDTPMVMFEAFHETGEKTLLNGTIIPDGQTGMQDIESAIDNIFNHPNVGPFIGKQLIQRLVTSNPSPGYVSRVAAAFNGENGSPRGDMQALLRAILEDPEAQSGIRLREPFRRYVALNRSLEASSSEGIYPGLGFIAHFLTQQNVMSAPSVFNFYLPDYIPPGELGDAGLVAPEFQITNASTVTGMINVYAFALYGAASIDTVDGFEPIGLNFEPWVDLADSNEALLDQIDLVFFSGTLGEQERTIVDGVLNAYRTAGLENIDLVRVALYLLLSSASYAVQGEA